MFSRWDRSLRRITDSLRPADAVGAGLVRLKGRLAGRKTRPPVRRSRPSPGFSWITPDIAVGRAQCTPEHLAAHGITAVLDVRAEAPRQDLQALRRHGLEVLRLRVLEDEAPTAGQLRLGAGWAGKRLERGGRLLIQCRAGAGRSATLAIAVLVVRGQPPFHAYQTVRARRPRARLSSGQMESVLAFAGQTGRRGTRISPAHAD